MSTRNSALHDAVEANNSSAVQSLLDRKSENVNIVGRFGRTPLHLAAKGGLEDIVQLLLQYGANANLRSAHGHTPFFMAAVANQVAVLRLLVHWAPVLDVDAADLGGMSPLAAAVCNDCSIETVECLIDLGAALTSTDSLGRTPVDWAREKNFPALHRVLVDHANLATNES